MFFLFLLQLELWGTVILWKINMDVINYYTNFLSYFVKKIFSIANDVTGLYLLDYVIGFIIFIKSHS